MSFNYTSEKNVLMLVALLKAYGIKRVIASPGTTNMTFVASLQHDSFFEIYSAPDERSACYMACGMADESGESVVITCTGATASRNYLPGLTEAYYRKLPILAVTATQNENTIGHLKPQVIDRSSLPADTCVLSVHVSVADGEDLWACNIKLNQALDALTRKGGGPVHINMATTYSPDFSIVELPHVTKIERICQENEMPALPNVRTAVFAGAHKDFDDELQQLVDEFCRKNNAVVFCDHTSGYHGEFRANLSLLRMQPGADRSLFSPSLLIHIGEVSGSYTYPQPQFVWRVSEDGEIRDTFKGLVKVFEMDERDFFKHYAACPYRGMAEEKSYIAQFREADSHIRESLAAIELPFSNIWVASQTAHKIPSSSVVHLGILNSLRAWNFFNFPKGVRSKSNVGGFGIDGPVSTLIGASLVDPECTQFGIIGDLAFFYDMNSLGNRHVQGNLRIMLINNGKGTEFTNFSHPCSKFGAGAENYMAAAGHYGNKSPNLVRHYAEDLGFEYLSASNKDEFLHSLPAFLDKEIKSRPVLFEVFTDSKDESDALYMITHLLERAPSHKEKLHAMAAKVIGEEGISFVKKILK